MIKSLSIAILSNHWGSPDIERDLLLKQGYSVESYPLYGNLSSAEKFPDLFIIDSSDVDSFKLVEQIRSLSAQVGVLIIISLLNQDDRVRAFLSGADNYIVRPYEIEELLAIVDSMERRLRSAADYHR
jgi:DNA-binding response OmpR family regulator